MGPRWSVIVCPEPLPARAGQSILARGRNTVDAAIAAVFAQGVVHPLLGGMGLLYDYRAGDGLRTVPDAGVTIGSQPMPESWPGKAISRGKTTGRYLLRSEENQIVPFAQDTHPHMDGSEHGGEAGRCLLAVLAGQVRPHRQHQHYPERRNERCIPNRRRRLPRPGWIPQAGPATPGSQPLPGRLGALGFLQAIYRRHRHGALDKLWAIWYNNIER